MENNSERRWYCDFVYGLWDDDAGEFGPLFECVNDTIACKKVVELLKGMVYEEFRKFGRVDADNYKKYSLYSFGLYDRLEGVITPEKRLVEFESFKNSMINKMEVMNNEANETVQKCK